MKKGFPPRRASVALVRSQFAREDGTTLFTSGPLLWHGAIGAGFTLSAVGLGLQHRGLDRLGVDPGWGLYAAGTALGGAGLLAGGAASFLRGTEYAPEEQRGPLALSLAIAGASCLITASVLYLVDGGRLRRAFLRWQQTR